MSSFTDVTGKPAIVRCPFPECNARIIKLSSAATESPVCIDNAPTMLHNGPQFFAISDVWDFDNIGVSRPAELESSVEGLAVERLLICSECDRGPLGFAGFGDDSARSVQDLSYYLSASSVKYEAA